MSTMRGSLWKVKYPGNERRSKANMNSGTCHIVGLRHPMPRSVWAWPPRPPPIHLEVTLATSPIMQAIRSLLR